MPARHRSASHLEARLARFRCIEGWYDPHDRHSSVSHRSPLALEEDYIVLSAAVCTSTTTAALYRVNYTMQRRHECGLAEVS